MTDYKKPIVYNPRVTEERIAELEAKVQHQSWRVMKLLEENTNLTIQVATLQRINDSQWNTIRTYSKIFQLQEAELKKYRKGKHYEIN